MTKDEVLELAKKCGIDVSEGSRDKLISFAAAILTRVLSAVVNHEY